MVHERHSSSSALDSSSPLIQENAYRVFVILYGCKPYDGTEKCFACMGCQEDFEYLRELIVWGISRPKGESTPHVEMTSE